MKPLGKQNSEITHALMVKKGKGKEKEEKAEKRETRKGVCVYVCV